MADTQSEEVQGRTTQVQETPQISAAKSVTSPPKSKGSTLGRPRTEVPHEPENPYHAFEAAKPDPTLVGAPQLEQSLQLDKRLGWFYKRSQTAKAPTYVNIRSGRFRLMVEQTLQVVLIRLLRLQGLRDEFDIASQSQQNATELADGICVLTYLKLRAVNSLEAEGLTKFSKKPQAPVPFMVPYPYALAISDLGVVKAGSMEVEFDFCPTASEEEAARFLLPEGTRWNTGKYTRAMEYAKKIGMRFASVDLSVKLGGSWWLLRPVMIEDIFTLRCTLPEDNYTKETAVMRTLFVQPVNAIDSNEIFDLSTVDDHDYGSFVKRPFDDINVTTYFALEETAEEVWKVV